MSGAVIPLGELTLERAKSLQGMQFDMDLPDGRTVTMRLDDAVSYDVRQRRRPRSAPVPKREPFGIYLLGSPSEVIPQGTYTLHCDAAVLENVFIVPVGQDAEATEYEAVFT